MSEKTEPPTSVLWTDGYGLRLRQTTSSEVVFLDVLPTIIRYMHPFMELKELKAIWHSKAKGWLIPTSLVPAIEPFLRTFHFVLPESGRPAVSAGREWRQVNLQTNRAAVYNLTYQEVRLLAMLFVALIPSDERSEMTSQILNDDFISKLEELNAFVSVDEGSNVPGRKISESLDELCVYDDAFLDLFSRYTLNRIATDAESRFTGLTGSEVGLQKGDLLQMIFSDRNGTTTIYNIDSSSVSFEKTDGRFERLVEVESIDDLWAVPEEFKVPTPFSIMHWMGLFYSGEYVRPNFDRYFSEMTFEPVSKIPENVQAIWNTVEFKSAARLRFLVRHIPYSIYFLNPNSLITTYGEVISHINDTSHPFHDLYQAVDDLTMATWLD